MTTIEFQEMLAEVIRKNRPFDSELGEEIFGRCKLRDRSEVWCIIGFEVVATRLVLNLTDCEGLYTSVTYPSNRVEFIVEK